MDKDKELPGFDITEDESGMLLTPRGFLTKDDYLDATFYVGPDILLPHRFFDLLGMPYGSSPEDLLAMVQTNPPELTDEEWHEVQEMFAAAVAEIP